MTVSIAWIRKVKTCEELCFVSDSRLSGDGRNFDASSKILTLPRSDCAIAFAGYTGDAFPMMLQLSHAIASYEPSQRRSLELPTLRKHALKVFDGMSSLIESTAKPKQVIHPDATFLFGGYSWAPKKFELWSIRFRPSEGRFVAEPAPWVCYSRKLKRVVFRTDPTIRKGCPPDIKAIGRVAFAGDQGPLAKQRLTKLLESSYSSAMPSGLDMEPFAVVRDMLRDAARSQTIGGAPQLVKVYQYMQSAPFGVYWPDKKSGKVHLLGRPCLGYERIDRWVVDPDTLRSERPPEPKDPAPENIEEDSEREAS